MGCKIRGIRTSTGEILENDTDPNIRWVKVEWVDYGLQEEQIMAWLDLYGERAGELTEDIYPNNSDSEGDPICMGTYSIKMRLKKDIPQLIPMWGKRIRIYHRGVQKLCNNCYGNHARRNCKSQKVPWTQYVLKFMENHPEVPKEMYGRWWKIINDEYGEIVEDSNIPGPVAPTNKERSHISEPVNQPLTSHNRGHQETQPQNDHQTSSDKNEVGQKLYQLTPEEENNLSAYLGLGMSLADAREQFKKEVEVTEMRLRIRENARLQQRGSIGAAHRTTIGPTASTRGTGRGGLSFN